MSLYESRYTVKGGRRRGLWYVSFKDHRDVWRKLRGWTDKGATEELMRRLDRLAGVRAVDQVPDAELGRWLERLSDYHRGKLAGWGLLDERAASLAKPLVRRDDRGRVVGGHVQDHRAALVAKGVTPHHADLVRTRVAKLVEGCEFKHWPDIRIGAVEAWLAGRRAAGMKGNTSNHIATAAKSFCGWMVEDGRAAVSPLAGLGGVRVTDAVRFGVFTPGQVQALLDHCGRATDVWGIYQVEPRAQGAESHCERFLTGPQRALLYRFAAETALRAEVIRTLTADQVRLERDEMGQVIGGFIRTTVGQQKNRKAHDVPLRRAFAVELAGHLAGKIGAANCVGSSSCPSVRVFDVPERAAVMLRHDLRKAKLPLFDEDDLPLAFHSFRATCATWLGEAGLGSMDIAAITGHQSRAMCDHYTHATLRVGRRAIEKLPQLTSPRSPRETLGKDAAAEGHDRPADGHPGHEEPRLGGGARGVAGIEHRWVPLPQLAEYDLPPANGPITAALIKRLRNP